MSFRFVSRQRCFCRSCAHERTRTCSHAQTIRSLPEAERAQQTGALIKAYQAEIDKLTRRSKDAEDCFLALYEALAPAPDPLPAIELAADHARQAQRIAELEFENKRLQQQLSDFREEHASVQNQEVTVARLRERVKTLETSLDAMADERARLKESELRAESERAANLFKEKEQVDFFFE